MSRKKINVDFEVVNEKLSNFCDGIEIAAYLGISFDTLERRIKQEFNADFADYKAQKKAIGTGSLRELQMDQARKGNVSMLIFLGKNYLGQTDKADFTTGGEKIQSMDLTLLTDKELIELKRIRIKGLNKTNDE
ncbi:unnamed protein product [marine sediment metagenome]|uniref:Uncharacterized protein n=1 Tax=marine sediment metagenome TaxID=412755 RepID=X1MZB2_9ZZZZ